MNPDKLNGEQVSHMAEVLQAIGNPYRLEIFMLLGMKGPQGWAEIKADVINKLGEVDPSVINFHLHKLVQSGLVVSEGGNRFNVNTKNPDINFMLCVLNMLNPNP